MNDVKNDTEDKIVDFSDARQRADWQAKEARAQALKQRFQRAMGVSDKAKKPSGTAKKSSRKGRKKKK